MGHKAESIEEGILKAADSIDSGKALKKLDELVKFSNKVQKIAKNEK